MMNNVLIKVAFSYGDLLRGARWGTLGLGGPFCFFLFCFIYFSAGSREGMYQFFAKYPGVAILSFSLSTPGFAN